MSTVRSIFEDMKDKFRADQCSESVTYYFSVGEERWTVWVSPEGARAEEGKHVNPADCIIKADPNLFVDMIRNGKKPKPWHFGTKLKTNNPTLLLKMAQLFGLGS